MQGQIQRGPAPLSHGNLGLSTNKLPIIDNFESVHNGACALVQEKMNQNFPPTARFEVYPVCMHDTGYSYFTGTPPKSSRYKKVNLG